VTATNSFRMRALSSRPLALYRSPTAPSSSRRATTLIFLPMMASVSLPPTPAANLMRQRPPPGNIQGEAMRGQCVVDAGHPSQVPAGNGLAAGPRSRLLWHAASRSPSSEGIRDDPTGANGRDAWPRCRALGRGGWRTVWRVVFVFGRALTFHQAPNWFQISVPSTGRATTAMAFPQ
jgi:hypothetical protein